MLCNFNLCVCQYIYNISKHSLFKPVKQHVVWQLSHSSFFPGIYFVYCLNYFNLVMKFYPFSVFLQPSSSGTCSLSSLLLCRSHHISCFPLLYRRILWPFIFMFSVCIMYNPNSRLYSYMCTLLYQYYFICNFIWEIWKINWNWKIEIETLIAFKFIVKVFSLLTFSRTVDLRFPLN